MRIVRYTYPNTRTFAPAARTFAGNPWSGLETEIGRLFESALNDFAGAPAAADGFPVDLYEDKDNTYVRAELPGVKREEIQVELVDGHLTIAATRKTNEGASAQAFSASRSVGVSDAVQPDKISAAYENGILTVTLPKKEEAKPKKIAVSVN